MPRALGTIVGRAPWAAEAGSGKAGSVSLLRRAASELAGEAVPVLPPRLARSRAPPVVGNCGGSDLRPAVPSPVQPSVVGAASDGGKTGLTLRRNLGLLPC